MNTVLSEFAHLIVYTQSRNGSFLSYNNFHRGTALRLGIAILFMVP